MAGETVTLTGGPLDGAEYEPGPAEPGEEQWIALIVDGSVDEETGQDIRAVYEPDASGVWRHTGWTIM